MNSGIRVYLDSYGNETGDVPVRVEIFDKTLHRVEQSWLGAKATADFQLDPGIYGVRASVSSGTAFEQAVHVHPGKMQDCRMPLHSLSPHESHEWAYLTQSITKPLKTPSQELLSDSRYEGVWIRLWRLEDGGTWSTVPFPTRFGHEVSREEDGVSFSFLAQDAALYALQLGGPNIPWKCVALPPSYRLMVLVRPASAPAGRAHPLEVVISSDELRMESLLTLMQRGDTSKAYSLAEEPEIAERLLFEKWRNTSAAAVGAYFLLRSGELERLHDWTNNLANWFTWMADGPVIHAWQLIEEGRGAGTGANQVRSRLLEATHRGFPVYTEGLRLLRDGLLLFDRHSEGEDKKIHDVLIRVAEYAAAADWSVTTTTFTGNHPNTPSTQARRGSPRDRGHLLYVYDVPLREALRQGIFHAGDELTSTEGDWRCRLTEKGWLELPDGRSFKSLGALDAALLRPTRDPWRHWRVASTATPVAAVVAHLRI